MLKERSRHKKTLDIHLCPYSHNLMDYFVRTETINPTDTLCENLKALDITEDCFYNDGTKSLSSPTAAENEDLVYMIMRDRNFNPNNLISSAESKTLSGWRKKIKWTDNKGRMFKLTTGEGTMYKDSDAEAEDGQEASPADKIESNIVVGVESGDGSSVDPSLMVSPPSFDLESLRSSLESANLPPTPEQLSLMYSTLNNFNNKNKFAYDSSHFYSCKSNFNDALQNTLLT